MKRGGFIRRRTPLAPTGKKGARDRAELQQIRATLVERSGGMCEAAGFSDLCTHLGREIHHRTRRSAGGQNTTENCLFVCFSCHRSIHDNPLIAIDRGFLRRGGAA